MGLLFFVAAGGFAGMARFTHKKSVEMELEEQCEHVLHEASFPSVEVSFDHTTADLGGYVDSETEKEKVISLLSQSVEGAYFPSADQSGIRIRPTLPPRLVMRKEQGEETVSLEGVLPADADTHRKFLGSQLHAAPGVELVRNGIELDSRRLPFPAVAEFSSLSTGLIDVSERAEVILEDGVLTVRGSVPNPGIKFALLDLAERIAGEAVRDEIRVANHLGDLPPAEFHLIRTRFGVRVEGRLADVATRDALVEAVRAFSGGLRIDEDITVDSATAPAPWIASARSAIQVLFESLDEQAELHYGEPLVSVSGVAESPRGRERIEQILGTLAATQPSLDVLVDVSIRGEDGSESFPLIGIAIEENIVRLTGLVPGIDTEQALRDAVLAAGTGRLVESEMTIRDSLGRPPWIDALPTFVRQFTARVVRGEMAIGRDEIVLEGETERAESGAILRNIAINTFPPDFSVKNRIVPVDPVFGGPKLSDDQRATLTETLSGCTVYFDSGSDILSDEGRERAQKAAEAIRNTEASFAIIAGGYSDVFGDPESNRELTLRRVGAVRDYLVSLGVEDDRIEVKSLGVDRVHTSRSERWKARRVEISIASGEAASSSAEASASEEGGE